MPIQTVQSSNTFNQFRAITNLIIANVNSQLDGTANLILSSANSATINVTTLTVYGDAAIQGGDITTNSTTFTLANTTATSVRIGGGATDLMLGATTGTATIRNASTVLVGDLAVNGGDITTSATTFNVANATATTLSVGGAATSVLIGAATGIATIRNATVTLDGDLNVNGGDIGTSATTFNVANTTATSVRLGGAATDLTLGATTGVATIRNASTILVGDLSVNGGDISTNQTTFTLANTTATTLEIGGAATTLNLGTTTGNTSIRSANTVLSGELFVNGGDIFTTATTFTLANTTATSVRVGGAATDLMLGASTGTATIRNASTVLDGDLAVNGGDISTNQTTFTLANTTATTLSVGGAATSVLIGASTGTLTIRNASTVLVGDLNVNGGDIGTTATTFTVANSTATTFNIGGAATSVLIGAATGTATIRNSTVTLDGDLNVNGGDISTSATTFNVANTTATSVRLGGAATDLMLGATTGTTTIRNALQVTGLTSTDGTFTANVAVNGGGITTTNTIFTIANTTATTLSLGGAANVNIGSTSGNTTINSANTVLTGKLFVNGGDINTTSATFTLANTTATTLNIGGAANVNIGATSGNTVIRSANASITGNTIIDGDLAVNGGDITTSATTFTVANSTATTLSIGGAASVTIGATTGNTTIRNAGTVISGDLFVSGGDIVGTTASLNLVNTVTTTLEIGGAATTLNLGAATGNTTVRNNFKVLDNGSTLTSGRLVLVGNSSGGFINQNDNSNFYIQLQGSERIKIEYTSGDVRLNTGTGSLVVAGPSITTNTTSFSIANATSTTLNIGGAATSINMGAANSGTFTINNNKAVINSTGALRVPVGNTIQRGTASQGEVRYNTQLSAYEGYDGTNWSSLGGVKSVDGLTYIIAETSPGASDDTLHFYTANGATSFEVAQMDATKFAILQTTASANSTTGALTVAGGVGIVGNLNVAGTQTITGNTTYTANVAVNGGGITTTANTFTLANTTATTLELGGAANVNIGSTSGNTTIRSANAIITGNTIIGGNLTVNGSTTIINSTTLSVDDKNIIIADGAADNAAANGAGITIAGSNANVVYLSASDSFDINKSIITPGDIAVNGGDITTSATTFTLANTTATSVRVGGAATDLMLGATTGTATIRNATVTLDGDLNVNGGDIATNQTTFTVANTTATSVRVGGAATDLMLGATTGTATIRNATVTLAGSALVAAATFALANSVTTSLEFAGAATTLNMGAATGIATIRNATVNLLGDLNVNGGDIGTTATTLTVANTTATTLWLGAGATSNVLIGNSSGNTFIRSSNTIVNGNFTANGTITETANGQQWAVASQYDIGMNPNQIPLNQYLGSMAFQSSDGISVGIASLTGDLAVNGSNITTTNTTFTVANTTATTLSVGGAATSVLIGATTGNTVIRSSNTVLSGELFVNGGDIFSTATTFTLANNTATTLELGGSANVNIGSTSGNTTIRSANTVLTGDLFVNGGDIATTSATFTVANTTATTLSVGGAATSVLIGATTGTATIRNATVTLDGDLNVNGGDIATNQTTFTVANTTATTLNIGGAATSVLIGATTGNTTIRSANTVLTGDLFVNGGDIFSTATTFTVANTTATSVSVGGAATDLMLGAATGTATIRNASTVLVGDLNVNGGDIGTNQTTFTVANTTATSVRVGGAATDLMLGATTGTATIRNATVTLDGDLNVNGGDITTSSATFNVANATATTVNIGGGATLVSVGATTGATSIRNNLSIGNTSPVAKFQINTQDGFRFDASGSNTTMRFGSASTGEATGELRFERAAGAIVISSGSSGNTLTDLARFSASGDFGIGNSPSGTYKLEVTGNIGVSANVAVNGGGINTTNTIFTLANTTATTVNIGGAANVNIGSTTGNTLIRSANTILTGKLFVNGGDIFSTSSTFTLANNTATTLSVGGAATSVLIGAATGTATIRNATVTLDGDLNVNGGDIATTSATFTVANTTATSVSVGGAATSVLIGATTGTATIRNANVVVTGTLTSRYATKVANTDTATTLTPDVSANNQYSYTALATGLTINAPTGTPLDGERLTFRIKDNGTSRSLTWNAIYRIVGTVLPTATVASKINYVGCIYNSADTKWDVIAVAREA